MPTSGFFFRKRMVAVPTWRGWLCLLVLVTGLIFGFSRFAPGFLVVSQPVAANVLVVEGWVPDYAIEAAITEFAGKHYDVLVTSGGPMRAGALVSGYDTYSALAAAAALKR